MYRFAKLFGNCALASLVFVLVTLESVESTTAQPSTAQPSKQENEPAKPRLKRPLGKDRLRLAEKFGGNDSSEFAVTRAQQWIAKHQLPNGSWNFDHSRGPDEDQRKSPNPGDFTRAPRAATGMALLVFLGSGHTHQQGEFQDVVKAGLEWLIANGRSTGNGLSFYEPEGSLYNHAIATTALCEALALSGDPKLQRPCEEALRFTLYCQDPKAGGWRYEPKSPGDTSVLGWQLASLRAADFAGITIPPETLAGVTRFLESVDDDDHTFYGYTHPAADRIMSTTAIGLLGRIQSGWTRDHPALAKGARWIAEEGPQIGEWDSTLSMLDEADRVRFPCNIYTNYYATCFLFQIGDDRWKQWNETMRDFLIATQSDDGVTTGSWFFEEKLEMGYKHGGRLYATVMAAWTLQVYYRYPRIWDAEAESESSATSKDSPSKQ